MWVWSLIPPLSYYCVYKTYIFFLFITGSFVLSSFFILVDASSSTVLVSEFWSSKSSDSLPAFKSKLTELSNRFCSGCSLSGSFLDGFLLGESSALVSEFSSSESTYGNKKSSDDFRLLLVGVYANCGSNPELTMQIISRTTSEDGFALVGKGHCLTRD